MKPKTPAALENLLQQIAKEHLLIETLETRRSDRLDFHDVAVWGVKSALLAAFEAGRQAAINDPATTHQA
jgi:hypothetical protein